MNTRVKNTNLNRGSNSNNIYTNWENQREFKKWIIMQNQINIERSKFLTSVGYHHKTKVYQEYSKDKYNVPVVIAEMQNQWNKDRKDNMRSKIKQPKDNFFNEKMGNIYSKSISLGKKPTVKQPTEFRDNTAIKNYEEKNLNVSLKQKLARINTDINYNHQNRTKITKQTRIDESLKMTKSIREIPNQITKQLSNCNEITTRSHHKTKLSLKQKKNRQKLNEIKEHEVSFDYRNQHWKKRWLTDGRNSELEGIQTQNKNGLSGMDATLNEKSFEKRNNTVTNLNLKQDSDVCNIILPMNINLNGVKAQLKFEYKIV